MALKRKQGSEDCDDDERHGGRAHQLEAPPCRLPAAFHHVARLQLGRWRRLGGAEREPLFGSFEVFAVNAEARIPSLGLPLDGAHQQPGVGMHPIEVGVERQQQVLEAGVEVVVLAQPDPVQPCERGRYEDSIRVAPEDRQHPLVVRDGMCELMCADGRCGGIRAQDKDEGVGRIDRALDFAHPVGAWWNALPVDPGLALPRHERFMQVANEGRVLARVGDEDRHRRGVPRQSVAT